MRIYGFIVYVTHAIFLQGMLWDFESGCVQRPNFAQPFLFSAGPNGSGLWVLFRVILNGVALFLWKIHAQML